MARHYSLPWSGLVTDDFCNEVVQELLRCEEKRILTVSEGASQPECAHKGLTLRAQVALSRPGADYPPVRIWRVQRLIQRKSADFYVHCCADLRCHCNFCLTNGERLSQEAFQLCAEKWRQHTVCAALEWDF